MPITIDLPDKLALTESDLRREVAILLWRGYANALFQQDYIRSPRHQSSGYRQSPCDSQQERSRQRFG
jgi:hypothetical protein